LPRQNPERNEISLGGQAVIEGVVMRVPDKWALAVRRPSGEIATEVNPISTIAQAHPRANVFPLRGVLALIDSLVIGFKALSISAGISLEEAAEEKGGGESESGGHEGVIEELEEEAARGELGGIAMVIAMTFGLAVFLGVFIVGPAIAARYMMPHMKSTILYNLVEGGLRIAVFIVYLALVGLLPDIRRVFQYHGAEHKVVHAWEAGVPLDDEHAGRFSTAHMRCGTTFIVIVFVISVLVFSLMGRPPLVWRILERVAVIPFVAAISYEIIKFAGKHESSRIVRIVMAPGLLFQKLTTREPSADQLDVAIAALQAATGSPITANEPG
jgi:uncharacterized protein YqhQ